MSTPHQQETLNALLATVIAKSRPDGMLKAAECAATAFKAGLAIYAGAPADDLAALTAQVRAMAESMKRAAQPHKTDEAARLPPRERVHEQSSIAGEEVALPVLRF